MNIDLSKGIIRQVQKLKETKKFQLESLKKQLESTDYKIIKCYEYQMAGLELPYDIEELHNERQAIRDEINQLEEGEGT